MAKKKMPMKGKKENPFAKGAVKVAGPNKKAGKTCPTCGEPMTGKVCKSCGYTEK